MSNLSENKSKIGRKTDLGFCFLSLRDDGILHLHLKQYAEFNEPEAKILLQNIEILSERKPTPMITTVENFVSSNNAAKKMMSKRETNKYISASAILTTEVGYVIGTNLYLKIFKPEIPTRLFFNEGEAINWLRSFL